MLIFTSLPTCYEQCGSKGKNCCGCEAKAQHTALGIASAIFSAIAVMCFIFSFGSFNPFFIMVSLAAVIVRITMAVISLCAVCKDKGQLLPEHNPNVISQPNTTVQIVNTRSSFTQPQQQGSFGNQQPMMMQQQGQPQMMMQQQGQPQQLMMQHQCQPQQMMMQRQGQPYRSSGNTGMVHIQGQSQNHAVVTQHPYLLQATSDSNANTSTGMRRYSITYFHEQPKLGQQLEENLSTNEVFVKSIDPSMASYVTPYGLKPGDVIESLTASAEGINDFIVTQLNDLTMAILKTRPITITYRSSSNTGMMPIQGEGQNYAGVLQSQPMEQQGQSNNTSLSKEIKTFVR
eukprot:g13454.t1